MPWQCPMKETPDQIHARFHASSGWPHVRQTSRLGDPPSVPGQLAMRSAARPGLSAASGTNLETMSLVLTWRFAIAATSGQTKKT